MKRGFTLVELMIAIGIFASLLALLMTIGVGFTRKSTEAASQSQLMAQILRVQQMLNVDLSRSERILLPKQNRTDNFLHILREGREIVWEYKKNSLQRKTFVKTLEPLKGIEDVRFHLKEPGFMEITYHLQDEIFKTGVFLEALP